MNHYEYYKNPFTLLLISKDHKLELSLRFKLLALMNNTLHTNKIIGMTMSVKG